MSVKATVYLNKVSICAGNVVIGIRDLGDASERIVLIDQSDYGAEEKNGMVLSEPSAGLEVNLHDLSLALKRLDEIIEMQGTI